MAKAARAIHELTPAEIPLIIYDDASYSANVRWAEAWAASVEPERLVCVIAGDGNRGAAYGRNRILEACEEAGKRFVATVDADIEVLKGWLGVLAAMMERHANCGIATWRYCNDHGGRFPVADDGRVAEAASMCWLWRLAAVDAALGPDVVWGMDERLGYFSHDSEFCQRMKRCSGYRTFVSPMDLMCEIEQHSSHRDASATVREDGKAKRRHDLRVWQELEAARGWAVGKADVGGPSSLSAAPDRPRDPEGQAAVPDATAAKGEAPVANVEEAPMGRYVLARATDPAVLEAASSGGLVRVLLAGALESGLVDALVVVRGGTRDPFRPEVVVIEAAAAGAFKRERAFGSVYLPADPFPALHAITADERTAGKRIATVLLPCQARRLRELQAGRLHPFLRLGASDPHDPPGDGELANVVMTVELACNRVPSRRWVMAAVQRYLEVPPAEVERIDFRAGGWPGHVVVTTRSGDERSMPYLKFWGGVEAPSGDCARCRVPFTRFCDVVAADSWGLEALTGGQPATLACLHSEAAQAMVDELADRGELCVSEMSKGDFFRSMEAMLADKHSRGAVDGE